MGANGAAKYGVNSGVGLSACQRNRPHDFGGICIAVEVDCQHPEIAWIERDIMRKSNKLLSTPRNGFALMAYRPISWLANRAELFRIDSEGKPSHCLRCFNHKMERI